MASITITTTTPQDARLAVAWGDFLHPGTNATTAEVKAWMILQLTSVVLSYEDRINKAAVPPPSAFTPT